MTSFRLARGDRDCRRDPAQRHARRHLGGNDKQAERDGHDDHLFEFVDHDVGSGESARTHHGKLWLMNS